VIISGQFLTKYFICLNNKFSKFNQIQENTENLLKKFRIISLN
jgi:hypothetical protein